MDIIRIIQETATWIEKVNYDYEVNLYRTPELIPDQHYYDIPNNRKADVVGHIVSTRSTLLKNANVSLIPVDELYNYGRVMIFDINETVVDGAPEVASAFYLDIDDAPPYDTWLATGGQLNEIGLYNSDYPIKDGVVVAWVPQGQYFYVNEGIEVSCIDNFWWASNENINDNWNLLKPLFEKPKNIVEQKMPINIESRMYRLNNIMKELDKERTSIYYQDPKQGKPKSFFQKLFGR